MKNNEEYLKPSDVAKRLGVTRGAVYKWIREGKLRAVRFGDNAVRIPRSAMTEFERRAAGLSPESSDGDKLLGNTKPGLVAPELPIGLAATTT